MLSQVLSRLFLVRVTVGYAAMLVGVATTLLMLGPRVEAAVTSHMSTNLHNLARGQFATLIGSVFVTSSGYIYVWLPGLICLLALAELFWRSGRLILAFIHTAWSPAVTRDGRSMMQHTEEQYCFTPLRLDRWSHPSLSQFEPSPPAESLAACGTGTSPLR